MPEPRQEIQIDFSGQLDKKIATEAQEIIKLLENFNFLLSPGEKIRQG